jgi:alanine racemase
MNHRVTAEVSLAAIRRNINVIRNIIGLRTDIMAVVKADAYGHGSCEVARAALEAGAEWLGVASVAEALQLRKVFPSSRICIMSPFHRDESEEIVLNRFIPFISDFESALSLSKAAQKLRSQIKIHLEVDTGMGRSGVHPDQAARIADLINRLNGIVIDGLMTHFPSAEDDPEYTMQELKQFLQVRQAVEAVDIHLQYLHCAASASILRYPEARLNLVRPGLLLYGMLPPLAPGTIIPDVKHALTLKTNILLIRSLAAGSSVSYSRTYTMKRQSRIASLPVGYGDGYPRELSNIGHVLICGQKAPIVGRVCMDVTLVDVTDIPQASVGSEAILIGKQGNEQILAEDLARMIHTTEHDITTRLTSRVQRVFSNT